MFSIGRRDNVEPDATVNWIARTTLDIQQSYTKIAWHAPPPHHSPHTHTRTRTQNLILTLIPAYGSTRGTLLLLISLPLVDAAGGDRNSMCYTTGSRSDT